MTDSSRTQVHTRERKGRAALGGAGLVATAVLATIPFWGTPYAISLWSILFMWIALAYAWNLISGYSGYVSLGNTAFFGLGAYASAIAFGQLGLSWIATVAIGAVVTALVAVPIGVILLRLRGPFFAIGMLGLSEIFRILVNRFPEVTGGGAGMYLSAPVTPVAVYYVFFAIAILAFVVTWRIDRAPFGRHLLAIRDDEEAASVLGISTTRSKVVAFTISAVLTAAAGGTFGFYIGYIDGASVFPIEYNLIIVLMGALGGAGTLLGPLLGALAIGTMRETLWVALPHLYLLFFGIVMVLTVLLLPRGLAPLAMRLWDRFVGRADDANRAGTVVREMDLTMLDHVTPVTHSGEVAALEVEGLQKRYGGLRVIDGASFSVRAGAIVGLIGPNGSGKTTTLNLVSGVVGLDGGAIRLFGEEITGRPAHVVGNLGVGRTFQLPRLFERMTVYENMRIALPANATQEDEDRVSGVLRLVGLDGFEGRVVDRLSYGQRKLLEISRVLLRSPKILLLDEPFAGINPVVREHLIDLIRALQTRGITILIIGHEVGEMTSLCDEMVVLDKGRVLTTGEPEAVLEDPDVFEAYFGTAAVTEEGVVTR